MAEEAGSSSSDSDKDYDEKLTEEEKKQQSEALKEHFLREFGTSSIWKECKLNI